jgi:hypothetical protein
MSSSTVSIRRWSRPISPNSLTITTVSASAGSRRSRFSSVVLPAPRNPVSTVSGIGSGRRGSGAGAGLSDMGVEVGSAGARGNAPAPSGTSYSSAAAFLAAGFLAADLPDDSLAGAGLCAVAFAAGFDRPLPGLASGIDGVSTAV